MQKFAVGKIVILSAIAATMGITSPAAHAQLIQSREELSLSMEPTEKLGSRQTYRIAPSQFLRELAGQLTGAGILVAASSDATRLIVDVQNYDSGPYLGFAKTARITVAFRLEKTGGSPVESWNDACQATAGVDVQDAPDRNKTAVSLCLTMLGARLAEKLAGPRETIIVR